MDLRISIWCRRVATSLPLRTTAELAFSCIVKLLFTVSRDREFRSQNSDSGAWNAILRARNRRQFPARSNYWNSLDHNRALNWLRWESTDGTDAMPKTHAAILISVIAAPTRSRTLSCRRSALRPFAKYVPHFARAGFHQVAVLSTQIQRFPFAWVSSETAKFWKIPWSPSKPRHVRGWTTGLSGCNWRSLSTLHTFAVKRCVQQHHGGSSN